MASMTQVLPATAQPRKIAPGRGRKPVPEKSREAWIRACRSMLARGERIWLHDTWRGLCDAVSRAAGVTITTGSLQSVFGEPEAVFRAVIEDYRDQWLRASAGRFHHAQVADPVTLIDKASRFAAEFERETELIREWGRLAGEPDPPAGAHRAAEVSREIEAMTAPLISRAFSHLGQRFSPAQVEALSLLLAPWLGGSPLSPSEARPHLQVIMEMLTSIDTGRGGPVEMSLPDGRAGYVLRADPEDRPAAERAAATVKFLPPPDLRP
jgi:hypothetical protein